MSKYAAAAKEIIELLEDLDRECPVFRGRVVVQELVFETLARDLADIFEEERRRFDRRRFDRAFNETCNKGEIPQALIWPGNSFSQVHNELGANECRSTHTLECPLTVKHSMLNKRHC
jgi:hypothetical protein